MRPSCASPSGASPANREVSNKSVRRLWPHEGLQVPTTTRKKRLAGVGAHVGSMSLIAPWALDLQFDHLIDHGRVKMLNVIGEYTQEALADDVVACLDRLAIVQGPTGIRAVRHRHCVRVYRPG